MATALLFTIPRWQLSAEATTLALAIVMVDHIKNDFDCSDQPSDSSDFHEYHQKPGRVLRFDTIAAITVGGAVGAVADAACQISSMSLLPHVELTLQELHRNPRRPLMSHFTRTRLHSKLWKGRGEEPKQLGLPTPLAATPIQMFSSAGLNPKPQALNPNLANTETPQVHLGPRSQGPDL